MKYWYLVEVLKDEVYIVCLLSVLPSEKKEELWLIPMTKTLTPSENSNPPPPKKMTTQKRH